MLNNNLGWFGWFWKEILQAQRDISWLYSQGDKAKWLSLVLHMKTCQTHDHNPRFSHVGMYN